MGGQERIWKCAGCGVVLPISCDCVTNVAVSWEPEFTAILKADLRVETAFENVARDMREGRFPERSSPLMVRANKGERDPAVLAALPEVQALIAAAYETAAQRVEANETPCSRCYPDGWTDDAIKDYNAGQMDGAVSFAAAIRNLTPADATAALARVEAAAEVRGMRKAAEIAGLNAWKHAGDDDYSRGMDAGAIHQVKACCDAILARAAEIEKDAK